MSSIALPPPNAPNTSTVRLPSISELTLRSPISDNSLISPKDRLPTLRPLKGYVLGQVVLPQGLEYLGGLSPSLQYYSQPAAGQAPPIPQAPVVGIAHPHISPAGHGQAPQGQHIAHGAHPLIPINGPYQYVRQIPNGSPNYPIYYQQPGYTAYAIPEVINKPVNKCHRCGTTETPEWRRGPNGVRTLCNACGLFHAKLVKRKGAALAAEEVLNNKVCKGKNGRRISIKKHMFNESLLKSGGGFGMPVPPMRMGGGYPYQMIRQ